MLDDEREVPFEIYEMLRRERDDYHYQWISSPLSVIRHGTEKSVFIVATAYYVYLVKKKQTKVYSRWGLRDVAVAQAGETLALAGTAADADDAARWATGGASEAPAGAFVVRGPTTAAAAARIVALAEGARAALRTADAASLGTTPPESEGDSDTSSDTDGGRGDHARGKEDFARFHMLTTQGPQVRNEARLASVSSLLDSEFVDSTTLQAAYTRGDRHLVEDIRYLIELNERLMVRLVQEHYTAFLDAAHQCNAVGANDADQVSMQLASSVADVAKSADVLRQLALGLVVKVNRVRNVVATRTLLRKVLNLMDQLEILEEWLEKGRLVGSVTALNRLIDLAVPLAQTSLGDYVLHVRCPAIRDEITASATQQLNKWLASVRWAAAIIGEGAMTAVCGGWRTTAQRTVQWINDSEWSIVSRYTPGNAAASFAAPSGEFASCLETLASGATVQQIFAALGMQQSFMKNYSRSRDAQLQLDILDKISPPFTNPAEFLANYKSLLHITAGYLLIEEFVMHLSNPSVRSIAELHSLAQQAVMHCAARAADAAGVLQSVAEGQHTVEMLTMLSDFSTVLRQHQFGTSLASLNRSAEKALSALHSHWLQQASSMCANYALSDTLTPLVVTSTEEFDALVAKYHFHRGRALGLSIPTKYVAGALALPYSIAVPSIAEKILQFVDDCVESMRHTPKVSEVNNADSLLLEYLSVLFRTIASSLEGARAMLPEKARMQLAVMSVNAVAMPMVVSLVEQRYGQWWIGELPTPQTFGAPVLLSTAAKLFTSLRDRCVAAINTSLQADVDECLTVTTNFSYWLRLADAPQNAPADDAATGLRGVVGMCGEVQRLAALLSASVVEALMAAMTMILTQRLRENLKLAILSYVGDDYLKCRRVMKDAVKSIMQVMLSLETVGGKRVTLPEDFEFNALSKDVDIWVNQKQEANGQLQNAARERRSKSIFTLGRR